MEGKLFFTPGDIVYSSANIISKKPPSLKHEKLRALLEAEKIEFKSLYESLEKKVGENILVVGDTIVNSYTETEMIGEANKNSYNFC